MLWALLTFLDVFPLFFRFFDRCWNLGVHVLGRACIYMGGGLCTCQVAVVWIVWALLTSLHVFTFLFRFFCLFRHLGVHILAPVFIYIGGRLFTGQVGVVCIGSGL